MLVDPIEASITSSALVKARAFPQLYAVESKLIRLSPHVKLKVKRTKCSPDIGSRHCLREVVIYLRYDFDSRIILIERQFIPRTSLESTKEGEIKDLEDGSCT
jgi:hypothetical protein